MNIPEPPWARFSLSAREACQKACVRASKRNEEANFQPLSGFQETVLGIQVCFHNCYPLRCRLFLCGERVLPPPCCLFKAPRRGCCTDKKHTSYHTGRLATRKVGSLFLNASVNCSLRARLSLPLSGAVIDLRQAVQAFHILPHPISFE